MSAAAGLLTERSRDVLGDVDKAAVAMTEIVRVLRSEGGALNQTLSQAEDRLEGVGVLMKARAEDLAESHDRASDCLKSYSEGLREESQNLTRAANRAVENLRRVDEGVQIGSGKVSAAVDKAAQLFKLVTDALTRHSEDLTIKAEKASSDVEGVSSALNARADELGLAATRSVHSLREVSEAMRQRLTELQSGSERAGLSVQGFAEDLDRRGRDIHQASDDATRSIAKAAEELFERTRELNAAGDDAVGRVVGLADMLRREQRELSDKTETLGETVETGGLAMRRQIDDLGDGLAKAERSVESLNDTLRRQAIETNHISDQAMARLGTWDATLKARSRELMISSGRVGEQAAAMSDALTRKTAEMRDAADEAAALLRQLKKTAEQAGKEDFLRRASFISESLQSLAVDLARVMEVQITEDDWRRYNRGEKGVFVSKMLGFREKAKLAAIAKHREDPQFRDYVDRYLAQFDVAQGRARIGGVLSTALHSDMGKLHLILACALGRAFRTRRAAGGPSSWAIVSSLDDNRAIGTIQNNFGHCGIAPMGGQSQSRLSATVSGPNGARRQRLPQTGTVRSDRVSECPPRNVCRETSKTAVQRRSFRGQVRHSSSPVFIQEKGGRLVRQSRRENFGGNAIGGAKHSRLWSFRDQRRRSLFGRQAKFPSHVEIRARRCGRARGGSQRPPSRERLAPVGPMRSLSRPLGSRLRDNRSR